MPAANIPFPPMEAELVRELPEGEGWQYEPKWDGFRGVLENAGKELALWSRNERPLLRYFPELRPLGDLLPPNSALDGEIVIARDGALDFDAMQMRLHPAESRIRRLSGEIPAEFVVFDMLVWDGEPVWKLPLEQRRARVEALSGFRLSPATRDIAEARGWLERFEALGLDGVIAKKLGVPYLPGSRDGVVKIKEHKSADVVVVGVRWKKDDRSAIATLLLGATRGRRRSALRQGAGQPLPARHEVHPLARGQAGERLHVARTAPTPRPERTDRRRAVRLARLFVREELFHRPVQRRCNGERQPDGRNAASILHRAHCVA